MTERTNFRKEFKLQAREGHIDQYAAAEDLVENLQANWKVVEDRNNDELWLCTETEE